MCASDAARNLFCKRTPKQFNIFHGLVAQLVEQLTLNQWVQGSSPCKSTKNQPFAAGFFLAVAAKVKTFAHAPHAEPCTSSRSEQAWLQPHSLGHSLVAPQSNAHNAPCKSTKKPAFRGWIFSCSGCKG